MAPSGKPTPHARALAKAAERGDVAAMEAALHAGALIDQPFRSNAHPALVYAAEKNQTLAVEFLLARGADPLAVGDAGITALEKARTERADAAAMLLVPVSTPSQGMLLEALERGAIPLADALAARLEHLGIGVGPIHRLVRTCLAVNRAESIEWVLERARKVPPPIAVPSAEPAVAVLLATRLGEPVVQYGGADLGERIAAFYRTGRLPGIEVARPRPAGRASGAEPLEQAARSGDVGALRALLGADADVNAPVTRGRVTCLHLTAEFDHAVAAEYLISRGASLKVRDLRGSTPLHRAARHGAAAVLGVLLAAGAHVDALDHEGLTPLLALARGGKSVPALEALLRAGAKVTYRCPAEPPHHGKSVLHFLINREPRLDLLEVLLKAGADPNQPDSFGWTPLGAFWCGDYRWGRRQMLEAFRLLAVHGARPELARRYQNHDGDSMAESFDNGREELADVKPLFLAAGWRPPSA